ncbi:MAG: cytochrome c biogenesis protein ResB [Paenibacillaceae bacterium]|nr:cytochrome c biogenesis protein ResB [Paenibacillaceae bacterium]
MGNADERWESRYDGAFRRSQKDRPNMLDKVWNMFSSVKVGIFLIVLVLVGTLIGSLYPQQSAFVRPPPDGYYAETYGMAGEVYAALGLHRTYESWWFLTSVVLLAVSILIASIDRGIPLYRILRDQKIVRSDAIMRKQPVFLRYEAAHLPWARTIEALQSARYRVRTEGDALLAEKHRWSRAGPYVNHIGLIVFLAIIFIRSMPALTSEQMISLIEGERAPIAGTSYWIKNERFVIEWHEPGSSGPPVGEEEAIPKKFETTTVLYTCEARCETDDPQLRTVVRQPIVVNAPLRHQGMDVYQYGYEVTPQIRSVRVIVRDKQSNQEYGPIVLVTQNPKQTYTAGPYTITLINYFPEFALDAQGLPTTRSANTPHAPAYVFGITGGSAPEKGWTYVYFPREIDKERFRQQALNDRIGSGAHIDIRARSMSDVDIAVYTSTLVVRTDPTLPYLLGAALISMVGLIMGFYAQHRRMWIARTDEGQWVLAAHSHKNVYGLQRDVARVRAVIETDPHVRIIEQKDGGS